MLPLTAQLGEHDPRNDVLTSAKRAEDLKHRKCDPSARQRVHCSPFAHETTGGGHGASTATVYFLFTKQNFATCVCRRARGQAQEGHLVCASPGHDSGVGVVRGS